jgi:tripartite-type tricarboxylate transporter receptor subunit TctC
MLITMTAASALLGMATASAQPFPAKPVRIVVAYAAGGPVDTVARIAAQNLATAWGQQVVIDNRPGSGGALGTQAVVKAPPDGYTLLVTNSGPITAYPHLRKTLLYDFDRDLTPVSLLSTSSLVLVIHPALPAKTLPEFVALARKNPGKLSYATSGVGGIQHLAMVLLESRAGIRLTHVPYKGGSSAVVDILSGEVPVNFNSVLGALPFVQAGKLRALGVTTAQPSPAMPGVPTIASIYPGFELTSWLALYAPPGTPAALVDQLNRDVNAALNVPESKRRLTELGLELVGSPPAELRAYTRAESVLLGKLMAAAGIEKE